MTKLSLRFLVPLLLVLAVMMTALLPLVDRLTLAWFRRDLDSRSLLVAKLLDTSITDWLQKGKKAKKLDELFERVVQDERLYAVGFCDINNKLVERSDHFPSEVACREYQAAPSPTSEVRPLPGGLTHVNVSPVMQGGQRLGQLLIVHDMSFVERRSKETKRYIFYLFLLIGVVVSLVTVFVAQLSWRGWIESMRAILRGEGILKPVGQKHAPEFRPIVRELRTLIRDLESGQRMKDESSTTWTSRTLRDTLGQYLNGEEVIVVSNREPYLHVRKGDKIEVQFPASGLVSAVEPIMRACSGTWVAHGSGSADREVVDKNDIVMVPPENPTYRLKRVWLTEEEEQGYYYGFSNEGLWPLCHIAHVRPVFRASDWEAYNKVNAKFAEVIADTAKTKDPVILVQDYHFALLPKMLREKLPRATIITFWHIPWPNPEAFGICPWREEILEGMLGSTILGFHTRFHCNNFLDTVDRFMESRIDREQSTVSYNGKLTAVRQYPISIEWPPTWLKGLPTVDICRKEIRERHGIAEGTFLGVGVDRMDYTKGILERLAAVERCFEKYPELVGKLTFLQIAAPSRSKIDRYRFFQEEVDAATKRINERFGRPGYSPIILLAEHHPPAEVFKYLRACDFCFVSSLHDGMNLVAKEFVAARDDERGVLILSMFTGAARELPEAFVINPYNAEQCADAIRAATEMSPQEQRERMRAMRSIVSEFNVFRWAGRMISDAVRTRQRRRLSARIHDWDFQGKGV